MTGIEFLGLTAIEMKECMEGNFNKLESVLLSYNGFRKVIKKSRPFLYFASDPENRLAKLILIDGYSREAEIFYDVEDNINNNQIIVHRVIKRLDGVEIDRYDRS